MPIAPLLATVEQSAAEKIGTMIGPYKLLQRIGEGGMGVVFMAEQTNPISRRVALKIIKPGMDTRDVIARFEAERQALSIMDHPNIAKVLDAGTTEAGQPYFVMELVKGVPITDYCDDKQLSVAERLQLFVTVCQAVQHAHQKGVIHRDLKPSNILVAQYDDRAVSKIIDFGVAKATNQRLTEKTLFTRFGQIVGTFAYMSPEQAKFNELDVDTRTDLYSLGVVLYELLTGDTPHAKQKLQQAALDEIIRIIRQEDPLRPSARISSIETLPAVAANRHVEPKRLAIILRGELDWIVMKALEKDRARRYETANALAVDIQRHLDNEPVSACPPSATYRIRKAVRRHKMAFGAAFAVASSLLIGLVGTAWFAMESRQNFVLAEKRAEEEERQRVRATEAEALARARLAKQTQATTLAEDAVRDKTRTLYALNTSFGLDADEPADALLWFTEAAKLVEPGSHEARACAARYVSWRESAFGLAHYFEHDGETLAQLEYDPSGKFIATRTNSGRCAVWEMKNDVSVAFSMTDVSCFAWSPSGEIALAVPESSVLIVSIPDGKVNRKLSLPEPASALAYDQHGNQLAIGGKSLRMWNLDEDSIADTVMPHGGRILSISFSDDGSKVLTSADDRLARVFSTKPEDPQPLISPIAHRGNHFPDRPWVQPIFVDKDRGILTRVGPVVTWTNIATNNVRATISSGVPNATSMVSSPDRMHFAISWQESYQIWSTADATKIAEQPFPSGNWGLEYSPDGMEIALMKSSLFTRIGAKDGNAYGPSSPPITLLQRLKWSPDGRHIAAADFKGRVAVWAVNSFLPYVHKSTLIDARMGGLATVGSRVSQLPLDGKGTRLKRSESGEYVLVAGSNWIFGNLREAALISLNDSKIVHRIRTNALLLDACLSPDEQVIATATLDRKITFHDLNDRGKPKVLATLETEPLRITFGPRDDRLIVLEINGRVTAFDTHSHEVIWTKQHPGVQIPSFQRGESYHIYSGDGSPYTQYSSYDLRLSVSRDFVVTCCGNEYVCVWDSRDGSPRISPVRLGEGSIAHADISSDGHWLAVTADRTEVWDLESGRRESVLEHTGKGSYLTFDSSGRRLAISARGECSVWDWRNKKRSCPIIRSGGGIFAGPREEWLLLAVEDGQVRLFSATSGRPVSPVWPLSFHPKSWVSGRDRNEVYLGGISGSQDIGSKPVDRVSLAGLVDGQAPTVVEMQLCAEVLSGQRIQDGTITKLSGEEWVELADTALSRWRSKLSKLWSDDDVASWHRNQRIRAIQQDDQFASRWHTKGLLRQVGFDTENWIEVEAAVLMAEMGVLDPESPFHESRFNHVSLSRESKAAVAESLDAVSENGAFVLSLPMDQLNRLDEELKRVGLQMSTLRVVDRESQRITAGWIKSDKQSTFEIGLTRKQWMDKHRGLTAEGYRCSDLGTYHVESIEGSEPKFFGLWRQDEMAPEQRVAIGISSAEVVAVQNRLQGTSRPIVRQVCFAPDSSIRYSEIWESATEGHRWAMRSGLGGYTEASIRNYGLPVIYVDAAAPTSPGENLLSVVMDGNADSRHVMNVPLGVMQEVGIAMLNRGFRINSLSVTRDESGNAIASAVWLAEQSDEELETVRSELAQQQAERESLLELWRNSFSGDHAASDIIGAMLLETNHFQPGNVQWNLQFAAWLLDATEVARAMALARSKTYFDENGEIDWVGPWIEAINGKEEGVIEQLQNLSLQDGLEFQDVLFLAVAFQNAGQRDEALKNAKRSVQMFDAAWGQYNNVLSRTELDALCLDRLESFLSSLIANLSP